MTPTIPRRTRDDLRANLHRKTKSEPVTPEMAFSIPEDEPCSPPAPERRSTELEEVQTFTYLPIIAMLSMHCHDQHFTRFHRINTQKQDFLARNRKTSTGTQPQSQHTTSTELVVCVSCGCGRVF